VPIHHHTAWEVRSTSRAFVRAAESATGTVAATPNLRDFQGILAFGDPHLPLGCACMGLHGVAVNASCFSIQSARKASEESLAVRKQVGAT
jgi:hypothetical protein